MKTGASLSIGDRELPLEADFQEDANREHSLVGKTVEVSPIAGGDLYNHRGKNAEVTGVYQRYGTVVGYEVKIGKDTFHGTRKDLYVDRSYLEDLQPPTATSAALREALSHWSGQRDYWHTRIDGLEAFCFDLASVTPSAIPVCHDWGWQFHVPSPMPGDRAVVDCRAAAHDNYWTLTTSVYPERYQGDESPRIIDHHLARVFTWTHQVAVGMSHLHGFNWDGAVQGLRVRAEATTKILIPLVERTLERCIAAKQELTGELIYFPPGALSVAFSDVRLKAARVGLLEPPTDRRPYSVMSISPTAARKGREYIQQVVLHECIHLTVGSNGGDPHGEEFISLADRLGLGADFRD
jgi:hypothetical protein